MGSAALRAVSAVILLSCLCAVAWPADVPSAPERWTEDQCKEAIRKLVGEPEYPLELSYAGEWPYVLRQWRMDFSGPAAPDGNRGIFSVNADLHIVEYARLAERTDPAYFAFGAGTFRKATADPVAAEALARNVAEAHCPQLLAEPFTYAKRLDSTPYMFTWEGIAEPWGVRISFRRLTIGVDARTGLFCSWELQLDHVLMDPKPRKTRDEITHIMQEYGFQAEDQTGLSARLTWDGRRQTIVWDGVYAAPHGSIVVMVADRTGRLLAAM